MKIAVAMSGGVDSLRSAILLRKQGHDVLGIHMRLLPLPQDSEQTAEIVAERERLLFELAAECEIPLTLVDLRGEFDSLVVSPFIESYRRGLTPNPCILCNPGIKFGALLREALKLGAQKLATGHYARVVSPEESGSGRWELRRGSDASKDQSYFLMGLGQEQLARAVFPLGGFTKQETLAWAGSAGLNRLIATDSQEVCFIVSGGYRDFVRERSGLDPSPGPVLDMDGNRIGTHEGVHSYTIGQRRGLGIASTEPYYVIRIEPEANAVRVGRARDLFCEKFSVSRVNWVSIDPGDGPVRCEVRIRNLHRPARAEVAPLPGGGASVTFLEPQRAVTPGQAAVFYSGDLLLGGGIIERPA